MSNETLSVLAFIGLFVGTTTIVCLTTIIHAVLDNKQKRWEILHGHNEVKDIEDY